LLKPETMALLKRTASPPPSNDQLRFWRARKPVRLLRGAISGTFWKFKAPYPGLIGPGGVRLPAQ
jgi:hypothetical protein